MAGLHINELQTQHLDYIGRVRPAVNLFLNPKAEHVAEIKARSPESKLIGRPYVKDGDLHDSYLKVGTSEGAKAAGRNAAQLCLDQRLPDIDAWIVLNEPPIKTVEQARLLAEFDSEFARQMSKGSSRGCIGAFSRGTPEIQSLGGGAILDAYAPALFIAYDVGAWLAIHQYGRYPLLHESEYLALRWQTHLFRYYRSKGVPIPRYVVTEYGFDAGVGVDAQNRDGWRASPYSNDLAGYANDLLRLANEYVKDSNCLGATVFCAGNMSWQSFAVDGPLLDYMATLPWPKFAKGGNPAPVPPHTSRPESEGPAMPAIPAKPPAEWRASPNITRGALKKDIIVWHHTGGRLAPSLDWLTNPASGVSTDYIISKTGKIYQLVAESDTAWHAGFSRMPDGREDVNRRSFGFELENAGDGKDPYPEAQIAAAVALARHLVAKNNIPRASNVTHELIRRLWKQKYPNRTDVSAKSDPRGLDMAMVLDRIYAPIPVPAPKPNRAPLPEDEIVFVENGDLKSFLQKSAYWMEEYIRVLGAKQYTRASAIRVSLAKLLTAGRDRWAA